MRLLSTEGELAWPDGGADAQTVIDTCLTVLGEASARGVQQDGLRVRFDLSLLKLEQWCLTPVLVGSGYLEVLPGPPVRIRYHASLVYAWYVAASAFLVMVAFVYVLMAGHLSPFLIGLLAFITLVVLISALSDSTDQLPYFLARATGARRHLSA
jgi:hypothetical protein